MKTRTILISIILFISIQVSKSQIKVNSTGFITLLGNNNYNLVIDNTGYYGAGCIRPNTNNSNNLGKSSNAFREIWCYYGTLNPSDGRQKENVTNILGALKTVKSLQGVRYDLKKEYAGISPTEKNTSVIAKLDAKRKNKIGFIAQDLQKYIPEAVVYDDSTDIYGVDYSKVVPVLVEAMKEQQTTIESLQADIAKLKKASGNLKSTSEATDILPTDATTVATLAQNAPNPFNQSTTIAYYLPETTKAATFYIYDMNGVQMKSFPIQTMGSSSITIQGSELRPGMYLYTLIADGKEVDTKRMILTE